MRDVDVAFKILEDDEHLLVGYKKSCGQLIFDDKIDFNKKARWVKDGNTLYIPRIQTMLVLFQGKTFISLDTR